MAWSFDGYIVEEVQADQVKMLRKHIKEVSAAISAKVMSDGTAYDPAVVKEYRKDLVIELNDLKGGGSKLTRGRLIKKGF